MRRVFFLVCLLFTLVLAGCGGSTNSAITQQSDLTVQPTAATLRVGDVLQLQATAFSVETNQTTTPAGSWSSTDPTIVKVNSDGLLLGTGEGGATVTFVSSSGQSVGVVVSVTPRVTSLTISPINAAVKSGSSFQFTASGIVDGKEQDVTNLAVWGLDNTLEGTASVSTGLLVTGSGSVTAQTVIQVTVSYGGLQASAPAFVNP